ncbi:hypothetical protein MY11210_003878 [Beauveria gryllotalpidicola]
MALSIASSPIKESASPSPPSSYYQSVLDWASPDEERDNPGKLDAFGHPLASFHKLRTRESNKKPGNWTVKHAIHVARWEFHQAGHTSMQLGESHFTRKNVQLGRVRALWMAMLGQFGPRCTSFVQASAKVIHGLEKKVRLAVESIHKDGCGSHSTTKFPRKYEFLAAKFSSPTGALPAGLLQNLEMLRKSDYLQVEASFHDATLQDLGL